jgi:hypothetical protein
MMKHTRQLKQETTNQIMNVEPNANFLHPITLEMGTNNTNAPICLTKLFLDNNNNMQRFNKYKCVTNHDEYKNVLYIPPIGYNSTDIIRMYEINTIDNLNNFINENLMDEILINRILNCWIKSNFDILIKHNNILNEIYNKIIQKYYSDIIKNFNLDKSNFINEWFSQHHKTEFHLDLLSDYISYIKKNI